MRIIENAMVEGVYCQLPQYGFIQFIWKKGLRKTIIISKVAGKL